VTVACRQGLHAFDNRSPSSLARSSRPPRKLQRRNAIRTRHREPSSSTRNDNIVRTTSYSLSVRYILSGPFQSDPRIRRFPPRRRATCDYDGVASGGRARHRLFSTFSGWAPPADHSPVEKPIPLKDPRVCVVPFGNQCREVGDPNTPPLGSRIVVGYLGVKIDKSNPL
jgi:hypothetical protein